MLTRHQRYAAKALRLWSAQLSIYKCDLSLFNRWVSATNRPPSFFVLLSDFWCICDRASRRTGLRYARRHSCVSSGSFCSVQIAWNAVQKRVFPYIALDLFILFYRIFSFFFQLSQTIAGEEGGGGRGEETPSIPQRSNKPVSPNQLHSPAWGMATFFFSEIEEQFSFRKTNWSSKWKGDWKEKRTRFVLNKVTQELAHISLWGA